MTEAAVPGLQPPVSGWPMTRASASASLGPMNEHFGRILHEQKTGEWRREADWSRMVAASRQGASVTPPRPGSALGDSLRRRLAAIAAHLL
jgi:hypothetical protein